MEKEEKYSMSVVAGSGLDATFFYFLRLVWLGFMAAIFPSSLPFIHPLFVPSTHSSQSSQSPGNNQVPGLGLARSLEQAAFDLTSPDKEGTAAVASIHLRGGGLGTSPGASEGLGPEAFEGPIKTSSHFILQ